MEGNNTYLDPPDVSTFPTAGAGRRGAKMGEQAANVSSGRAMEKETKSFAFDKSYWCAVPMLGELGDES